MAATWLKNAVFYEIYPQSFYDTNGDGIGDLQGIIEKLPYIKGLGCNALWINPCFDSPFKDAGYDVRDFKKVAPRYGTNEDLVRLFEEAHKLGIHVLLDLVAGHSSEEHFWFTESKKAEKNEYSDRYIWTDFCFKGADGLPYIGGESDRDGCYVLNFFKCQPALNYGFLHPTQPWQQSMQDPGPMATREALKDIMRFWLSRGCDGFRVDMASSLVKHDDEKKSGTSAIWRDVRRMLDREFPEAAMVAEWSNPSLALRAGYDMDFLLNERGSGYSTLLRDSGYSMTNPPGGPEDHTYFRKDGKGNINRFLDEYMTWYEDTKGLGYMSLITGNHDTMRVRRWLSSDELKMAYAFLFTMPGVPFLYYGDEIGMRYLELPTKEGGYYRTGARTPMQWTGGKNLGFSEASAEALYLPVDASPDAPTVEAQKGQEDSLLETTRRILALRQKYEDLQADAALAMLCTEPGRPLVYRRGGLLLAMNVSGSALQMEIPEEGKKPVFGIGEAKWEEGVLEMGAQSFLVLA